MSIISIPISANGWVTKHKDDSNEVIKDYGLANWMSSESVISVYFHCSKSGQIEVSLKCKVPEGKSHLKLTIDSHSFEVDVDGNEYKVVKVGNFSIQNSGYVKVDMQGVNKTGGFYADVSHLIISGELVDSQSISYIHSEPHQDIYWGRRGPYVQLFYHIPTKNECDYYYNEVTVPEGYDPIGSYFAVIGFESGYFGIQVNSKTLREVIFSVWSPFKTNNPKEIPEDSKVILVSKGTDVTAGEFGNEGSGAHSSLKYIWSPGITYKFLVNSKFDSTNTIYTAWFAEHDSNWKLIASFKRPKTHKNLSGFYSFVENFEPNTGFITRKASFGNQWVCDTTGKWQEVTTALFLKDENVKRKVRVDFDAGIEKVNENQSKFFLQNCGFITGKVGHSAELKRIENKIHPNINFKELPQV